MVIRHAVPSFLVTLLLLLIVLPATAQDDSQSQDPSYVSFDTNLSNLLKHVSSYEAKGIGKSISLSGRINLYKRWGLLLSGHYNSSHNRETKERLSGYGLMAGVSYMHPITQNSWWLEGSLLAGYLMEMRLFTPETGKRRADAIPFIAPSIPLRGGVSIIWTGGQHFFLRTSLNYWYAPLSRPYDRSNKVGLHGFDFGVGLGFLF